MDNRLLELIVALIGVLGVVITRYVIPYIKANIKTETLAHIEGYVVLAVRAAEMIFAEKGMGEKKKEYVINFLTEQFNKDKIVVTDAQIQVLIEAAVAQLNLDKVVVKESE